jgi:hypothetical protein
MLVVRLPPSDTEGIICFNSPVRRHTGMSQGVRT